MADLQWPYPDCHVCKKSITSSFELVHEIGGYEKERKSGRGGTNHVIARQRTGRTAHEYCARNIPKQESLL